MEHQIIKDFGNKKTKGLNRIFKVD